MNLTETSTIWCETGNTFLFLDQPINSLTNIFFILIGVYILSLNKKKSKFQIFYGSFIVLTGIASFLYHATNLMLFEIFDFIAMFGIIAAVFIFQLSKLKESLNESYYLYSTITFILFSAIYFFTKENILISAVYYTILLSILFFLEIFVRKRIHSKVSPKNLFIAILLTAIAFIIWNLDKFGVLCEQNITIGHGLWHILTGIALLYLYRYLEEETRLAT